MSAREGTYAPLTEALEVDPNDLPQRSPELLEVLNYVRATGHRADDRRKVFMDLPTDHP